MSVPAPSDDVTDTPRSSRDNTNFVSAAPDVTAAAVPAGSGAAATELGDAVLAVDAGGRVSLLNPAAERLTGWTNSEAHGADIGRVFEILSAETRRPVEAPVQCLLRGEMPADLDDRTILRRRDGAETPVSGSAAPLRDGHGDLAGAVLVFRDVSEQRASETILRASEQKFRLLVEGATEFAMFLIDMDGRIVSWNEGARRILGYEEAEILGQPAALLFTPEDRESGIPERELAAAARDGRAADVRWHQRKDGSRFWADGMLEYVTGNTGEFEGFAKVLRDATRERLNAERLADSEERYRTLFESIDVGFCVIEMLFDEEQRPVDYRFLTTNPAFGRQTGLTNAVNRTARDLVPGLDTFWFHTYGGVALTGESVRFENYAPAMGRWFDVYALRVGAAEERKVGILFTDITDRRNAQEALLRSEERLRDAQERLEAALSAGNIATCSIDLMNDRIMGDTNLARMFSVAPESITGGRLQTFLDAIHPEDRDRATHAVATAVATAGEYADEYRVSAPEGSGSPRWLYARAKIRRDTTGTALAMSGVVTDVTERVDREQRERFLAELALRAQTLTDPEAMIADALRSLGEFLRASRCVFYDIDIETDRVTVRPDYRADDSVASIAGTWALSVFGSPVAAALMAGQPFAVEDVRDGSDRVPLEYVGAYEAFGVRSLVVAPARYSDRLVSGIGVHSATPRRWTPEEVRLIRTVVERTWLTVEVARNRLALQESGRRERALLTEIFTQAPAFMAALRGPGHVFELANPPYYQLIGHREVIGRSVAEALPEVVDQGFIGLLDRVYRTGEPFLGKDVPVMLQKVPDAPMEQVFIDLAYQPLFDEDGVVSGILAHGIDLTERKRLEQERERLLAETQARADREALVNQIGEAVRAALRPAEVLSATVEALGVALTADRCYYVTYDPKRDWGRIGPDWHRADLSSISGEYRMSDYAINRDAGYRKGNTQIIEDVHEHAAALPQEDEAPGVSLLDALGLRSLIRVPLPSEGVITALVVAMSGEARRWTRDDVRLVETIATQTRTAVVSARGQQRERTIAQQLQAALQPDPPANLPGMLLSSFYRPALEEAGVGGDGFDVFAVGEGCTALTVFDLAGKGILAASQVATVRNMLRYALHTSETVAGAVTTLSRVLVEQELLTGFATMFVGVYDEEERTLTYTNCGQEPGLIWRAASGAVEELPPTGPVLGGFIGGEFAEVIVPLSEGDVLALFTDGMTEVGQNRKKFLEVEGLTALFAQCCGETGPVPAADVRDHLIAGVEAHAGGPNGLRDDIALLVGVVAGAAMAIPADTVA